MGGGGLDSGLPRGFDARVRELLSLLRSAAFERKDAISNAFRDLSPLRQFGDKERLGTEFPPPTQAAWNDFLEVGAVEPICALLQSKRVSLVNLKKRVIRVRGMRRKLEGRVDLLRNHWLARQETGEVASDLVDQDRDARAYLAYRANERLRATQPDALRELEARFGASSLTPTVAPPPPMSLADCFDKELELDVSLQRERVLSEETKLLEEWKADFETDLNMLRMHQLVPSTGLEGQPIGVMPYPFMASKERMRTIEQNLEDYNTEIKRKLTSWSYQLEIRHTDVISARARLDLANSARHYKRLLDRARDGGDEDDAREADSYKRRTLQPFQGAYEDILLRAMERLSGVYRFNSAWEIKTYINNEIATPMSEDTILELNETKERSVSERDSLSERMRTLLSQWGPQLALHDSMANRLLEAYEVRHVLDADPVMTTTIRTMTPRLLAIFMTSPWHERNHRGGLGMDESTARVKSWLAEHARAQALRVDLNLMDVVMEQEEPRSSSSDQNQDDPNRPFLPLRIQAALPPLPTLAMAAQVATAALRRRALATNVLR
jgi:hypothetical protein